jgi:hypothetical protein
MSRESREYASGYLGAVSRGLAAFELTRPGCGELLSSSLSTPHQRQPPLPLLVHSFLQCLNYERSLSICTLTASRLSTMHKVEALYYDAKGASSQVFSIEASRPKFPS